MHKYDIGPTTPIRRIKKLLAEARTEDDIYVTARIVGVLRYRGCLDVDLYPYEKKSLRKALQKIRCGHKVLVHWLPIGYQTARLIWLTRQFSERKIVVTKRDIRRIRAAAGYYRKRGDKLSLRQLRSLVLTAKEIGLEI